MWSYFSPSGSRLFSDQEVQTIIQKNCHTESEKEEKTFYSLLEYTPFQDIQESNESIINLPKKKEIFLKSISIAKLWLSNCLYLDDDALSELVLELRDRARKGVYRKLITYDDRDTQTNLHVQPHVLDNEEVANVVLDRAVQTDPVSRTPSRNVSRIVSRNVSKVSSQKK